QIEPGSGPPRHRGHRLGQFGLAPPFVRQCQQLDRHLAGDAAALAFAKNLEGTPEGWPREQLVAIDQVGQCHRLATQGEDHMPVIDDMAVLAIGGWLRSSVMPNAAFTESGQFRSQFPPPNRSHIRNTQNYAPEFSV